ncbi:MAG: hypothetical protein ABW128_01140 [Rhizorhabdus sp.]
MIVEATAAQPPHDPGPAKIALVAEGGIDAAGSIGEADALGDA